ncbi:MAG: hypothetical protein II588_05470, partial [Paludibacteraceae bacterium]|nr:hypothetical protein [Paludibacteraceae bacterium]
MQIKRILLVAAWLLSPLAVSLSPLTAATRYASPNGNGDGSSYGSPTTWAAALSATQGGDTLYLLGGTYSFSAKQTIGTGKNGLSASQR